MFKSAFCKKLQITLAVLCFAIVPHSLASPSSGSSSASASASASGSTQPLEPIIVNLLAHDKYLQIGITLQLANPEVVTKVKDLMPMVRHNLIMLLSGKESKDIASLDGKSNLIEEIKGSVNKVLDVKEKNGVQDVYFINFVIQ